MTSAVRADEKHSFEPYVSFIMLAYNQEAFIEAALKAALKQDGRKIEIIVSDDCSSDQTFSIIQRICDSYTGIHHVIYRQNDKNFGLVAHLNKLLNISSGDIIVIAAGDDISLPHRVELTVKAFEKYPSASEFICSAYKIDVNCNKIGKIALTSRNFQIQTIQHWLKGRTKTLGAGRAINRRVVESFPPLGETCPTEDTTLLLRSLLYGNSVISSELGIFYRAQETSLSGVQSLENLNLEDIFNQYRTDIRHALDEEIINEKLFLRLSKRLPRQLQIRKLTDRILVGKHLSLCEHIFLLLEPNITVKMKLKLTFLSIKSQVKRLTNG